MGFTSFATAPFDAVNMQVAQPRYSCSWCEDPRTKALQAELAEARRIL